MKLRISSRAYRELANIADYLNARNPRAAKRVGDRIQRTMRLLRTAPNMGRSTGIAETRQFPVPGLPYLIVYRRSGDTIDCLAFFHKRFEIFARALSVAGVSHFAGHIERGDVDSVSGQLQGGGASLTFGCPRDQRDSAT